jgi:hypothetical protein
LAHEVERRALVDPAALARELESRESPLIVSGAIRDWPAVSNWTASSLAEALPLIEIRYKLSASNAHPDFRQLTRQAMFARGSGPLDEFMRRITTGPEAERARYLFTGDEQFLMRRRDGVTHVDPDLSPLLRDIRIPALFPESRLYTVWCWFSGRGVRTWLHYDNNGCHNLNAQVTGNKRCSLYPPEELARMHPFLLGGANPAHNCSAIDVEDANGQFASDLAAATAFEAELHAGDLLFIPAWWFHTFLHLGEFNSNVNFWWRPSHSRWNAVAARQTLLDAAAEAKLDLADATTRATLNALDSAAVQRQAL